MITMKSRSVLGSVRKNNEDMVFTKHYDDLDLAVVCDGLGGENAGEVASALAITAFTGIFDAMKHDDIPDLINRGVDKAIDTLIAATRSNLDFRGMGTTLTGVAFKGNVGYVFNIGDSRVYRLRGRMLEQLTEDDNELTYALKHPGLYDNPEMASSRLTKFVGGYEVEPDIQIVRLHNGDKFVVCSDGLYNMVSDEVIEAILMVSGVDRAVDDLTMLALKNGGVDNCTLVVAKYEEPRKPEISGGKTEAEKAQIRSAMTEAEKDAAIEEPNKELGLPIKERRTAKLSKRLLHNVEKLV
jgi:protein phosphatase